MMHKLSFREIIGILKLYSRSERKLDNMINNFFSSRLKGNFIILKKGRTAMQVLIDDFDLRNSEIIIPSWICSDVFVNLFVQNNIKPIIVDCKYGEFNISASDVKKKITKKTRAIIIVHSYGVPNNPRPFVELCRKKKIILIEDCAHSLDLKYEGKNLGNYGDAAIFSFVKEMPNFIGGLYVNNKREIKEEVKKEIKKSKLSRNDILALIHKFKFVNILKPFRKSVYGDSKISSVNKKIELEDMNKLGKAIFCYYCDKLDTERKREIALKIYDKIRDKNISGLKKEEISKFSGKCYPFLVKDKENILNKLEKEGLYPGRGWVPSFSTNEQTRKRWRLEKMPVSERYEKEIINVDLDEINYGNVDRLVGCFSTY